MPVAPPCHVRQKQLSHCGEILIGFLLCLGKQADGGSIRPSYVTDLHFQAKTNKNPNYYKSNIISAINLKTLLKKVLVDEHITM